MLFLLGRHERFFAELDLAEAVESDEFHLDDVAHPDNVFGLIDALGIEFGNMHQAFFAGKKFHECSEIDNRLDFCLVDGAEFRLGHDVFNSLEGGVTLELIGGCDLDLPSSSILIVVPVVSWISRTIFPPGPMISRILSLSILIDVILGANSLRSFRGAAIACSMMPRMCMRALLAFANASFMIWGVTPASLMSI